MVKIYRDYPEFEGAPLKATVPESALQDALNNGWKIEDSKPASKPADKPAEKPAEVKEEPKVEAEKPAEEKPLKAKKKLD